MKKHFQTTAQIAADFAANKAAAKKATKPRSVDNFISNGSKLIAAITTIGEEYDPNNDDISLVNIKLIQADIIKKDQSNVKSHNPEKDAQLNRKTEYKLMPKKCTRLLNIFKACKGITPTQVTIAKNLRKKVGGTRIIPIKNLPLPVVPVVLIPDTGDAALDAIRRNSVSHQDFSSRKGNLFAMVSYITEQTCYDTNIDEFTSNKLFDYCDNLDILNSITEAAVYATDKTHDEMLKSFFNNTKGARFIFTQAKNYISGKFDSQSVENKMVKGLSFPNLIKKSQRNSTNNF